MGEDFYTLLAPRADEIIVDETPQIFLLLGSATAVARPLLAQPKAMTVIGFIGIASPEPYTPYVIAFSEGLSEDD
jgi:hypothetical protein